MVGAGAGGTSGQKWQEPGGGWDTRLSLSDVASPTPPTPAALSFLKAFSAAEWWLRGTGVLHSWLDVILDCVGQKDPK